MPKPVHVEETVTVQSESENEEGNLFPTAPKDLSHVTFYFDATPDNFEDSKFFFVKIETPGHVDDDLDHWYSDALEQIAEINPAMADYRFLGAALKYGSVHSGGGEFYYSADDGDLGVDDPPTGFLVQGRDYKNFVGGVSYDYDNLFS